MTNTRRIKAPVWVHDGFAPWHFATISKPDAEHLKEQYVFERRGFGSIPVIVTVGKTTWKTSIFPTKDGSYVLPLKKEVRIKEGITAGDTLSLVLKVAQ